MLCCVVSTRLPSPTDHGGQGVNKVVERCGAKCWQDVLGDDRQLGRDPEKKEEDQEEEEQEGEAEMNNEG